MKLEHKQDDPLSNTGAVPPTVGDLIRWYLRTFESQRNWSRSKSDHLRFLTRQSVAQLNPSKIAVDDLVQHIWQRITTGASAATALLDLSRLSVVLKAAKDAGGNSIHPELVEQALAKCHEIRLLVPSPKRERRATPSEITRLDRYFQDRRRGEMPMHDILWFAIHSARQECEICQLTWSDLDAATRTGWLVNTSQHRQREKFQLTEEACAIALRQPRTSERIFPYHPQSVGKAFRLACHALGIDDLSFRDLRYEAALRLFENGRSINEVAAITLISVYRRVRSKRRAAADSARAAARPSDLASGAAGDP